MGFLVNIVSSLVVLIAIGFTIYANYPEPPLSPILYQWQTSGNTFNFKGFQIFYKGLVSRKNRLFIYRL
jgi:hypothetical protein